MKPSTTKRIGKAWQYVALAAILGGGCRSQRQHSDAAPVPSASSSVKAPSMIPPPPSARMWQAPSGITLPIFIEQGIGPIRFGATTATVERLMGVPCHDKTTTFCRQSDRGVNFYFDKNGALERIYISLEGRDDPQNPGPKFGVFNGIFSKRASLGMVPDAIIEVVGKPKKVVTVKPPKSNNTEEVHHYDSMVLEYDRIPSTGKLALSGVTLTPKPGTVIPNPFAPAPSASKPAVLAPTPKGPSSPAPH